LGTTVEALLDDDSAGSPLRRIVAAATDHGLSVGVFAGSPAVAARFRAHGISCIVVATDLWLVAQGAVAALKD
jgi:4-hydroxy-2-oxoheptanedioate aldolase